MKWLWLLALPYVVFVSTRDLEHGCISTEGYPNDCFLNFRTVALLQNGKSIEVHDLSIGDDMRFEKWREYYNDLAQALNDAHERRTQRVSIEAGVSIPEQPKKQIGFCGEDDCGKASQ